MFDKRNKRSIAIGPNGKALKTRNAAVGTERIAETGFAQRELDTIKYLASIDDKMEELLTIFRALSEKLL